MACHSYPVMASVIQNLEEIEARKQRDREPTDSVVFMKKDKYTSTDIVTGH